MDAPRNITHVRFSAPSHTRMGLIVNAYNSTGGFDSSRSRAPKDNVPEVLRRQVRYGLRGRVLVARSALRRSSLNWLQGLGHAYGGNLCTVLPDEALG